MGTTFPHENFTRFSGIVLVYFPISEKSGARGNKIGSKHTIVGGTTVVGGGINKGMRRVSILEWGFFPPLPLIWGWG